ncbi:hypothetical protein BCV70DRAFT_103311 [Testicularia cyperi]|uniref:Cyclin N-terminal domain-containing protein n=1 Tax=Testicularia cyperi TaxID=1882483 RepID=A0A317XQ92_9BASI|nr:hypothetical protein BCV70DRAFT_103311 [Testicularia cyperi]
MAPTAVCSRPADHGYEPTSSSSSSSTKQSTAASKPSSSGRSSHREPHDRFYGHRETSELCERFILYLFACPLDSTSASVSTPSHNGTPAPRLSEFIAYALYRTRLPEVVTYQALYLLLRLKIRFPAARGSSGHRLFISALMLASKSTCDDTYSNKSWTIVGQGLFSLREINQMERELFGYLGYKVNVEPRELELFTFELEHGSEAGRFDHVVRRILDTISRRSSLDVGSESPVVDRSEGFTAAPLPRQVPSLDAADVSSPPSESLAGPHRIASGRHSRQSSISQPFNSRASISGYGPTAMATSASCQGAVSMSMPTSVGMAKSASYRHERATTHGAGAPIGTSAPVFTHPFANNARDRCRPYTMPSHSVPLSASVSDRPYYSNSPAGSISSSSVCSSMSYAPSMASAMSATPSPCASRSSISGRTTPDTPPSDVDTSRWEDATMYYAGEQHRIGLSPTSKYYGQHGATAAAEYPHQQNLQHYQAAQSAPKAATGHSAAESYLHPYNAWRS